MKRVLFVCGENACRSQMAEAFARIHAKKRVEIYNAGSRTPCVKHPFPLTTARLFL